MPTSPDARTARAEAQRECILRVAERLFRTMGYQKTAVADIARELAMSPANLYRFFASKSSINEAITARLLGDISRELEAVAAGPGTAEARFRRFLSTKFERSLALFFHERRMHDMVSAAMNEHWSVIARFIETVQAALSRIISDGMRQGEFAPGDAREAARYCLDASVCWSHPMLIASCISQQGKTVEELRTNLTGMTDMLLRSLRQARSAP